MCKYNFGEQLPEMYRPRKDVEWDEREKIKEINRIIFELGSVKLAQMGLVEVD